MMASVPTDITLSDPLRERLDKVARDYYDAKAIGDDGRAEELVERIYGGLFALGPGSGRTVVPLEDHNLRDDVDVEFVVKLAKPHHENEWGGHRQNAHERMLWADTESRHLVPVVASDPEDYWLVMPRGEPVHVDDRDDEFFAWKANVENDLRDDVWSDDIDVENTVRLAGDYRLCDYGVGAESQAAHGVEH